MSQSFMHAYVPCTCSSAGSLSFFNNGVLVTALHVIFEGLVDDTVTLSVDMRRSCDISTVISDILLMPSFTSTKSTLLRLQARKLPTPVQLNSAIPLSETLIGRGGIVTTEEKRRQT